MIQRNEATAQDLDAPAAPIGPIRRLRALAGPVVLIGSALMLATIIGTPTAIAQGGSGAELYTQHCSSCHQATGLGIPGTFPPLVGNPTAADAAQVADGIRNGRSGPVEILGVRYDGVMPPIPALSGSDLDSVVAYVVNLAGTTTGTTDSGAAPADPAPAVGQPVVGDPDRGHDLFIGSRRLENGGAACAGCHTAGSIGNLGGSSLGPDLSVVFNTLGGEAGLTGWLGNPPSPTMTPIFADRPLGEGEVADLVAFLGTTPDVGPPDDGFDALLLAGAVATVALLAGMAVVGRGMRQTYLQRLRSKR